MSLKRFYAEPAYQMKAVLRNIALLGLLTALIFTVQDNAIYTYQFAWWHFAILPLAFYFAGLSAVFIHNATHNSFPSTRLNEFCGELAGIHQLWGYRGWRLVHLIHHQYSDDITMDPHPTKGRSFGEYLLNMFLRSSRTLATRYREHWGNHPVGRVLTRVVPVVLLVHALVCLAFWYALLGAAGFWWGFIPSLVMNHLIFANINYHCHPENPETGETEATNLNHNLYYKLGNFLWFGIYFHGNHHKKAALFNPSKMVAKVRATSNELSNA